MSRSQLFKHFLIQVVMSQFALGNEDSTKIYLKYNYITAPKYSLNGIDFKRTRNEFSFKSFYPEFKETYSSKYGSEPIQTAERQHFTATILGIPGGLLLGLGISTFLFNSNDGAFKEGIFMSLAASPFILFSIKLDFDSYQTLKKGITNSSKI